MPIINTWVPTAFVVLLSVLSMFTLLVFEQKTRVRVLHVAAVAIGIFSCYQLYCNIAAGLDFMSSMLFLIVGIVAIAVCEKVATFEQMKMVKEHEETEKSEETVPTPVVEENPTVISTESYASTVPIESQVSTEASDDNQSTTEKDEEGETAEDAVDEKTIENKEEEDNASSTYAKQLEEISTLRAQSLAMKSDDLEKDKAKVLSWFNKQIANFSDAEQLNLRKYAEVFLTSGEVSVRTIPDNNRNYTQQSITKICSAFRIVGMSREACAHFAKTVFAAFYPDTLENTIGKKFVGILKMREIIEESL